MKPLDIQSTIENYFVPTIEAIGDLTAKKFLGQALVICYSAIDTCGLLDAPEEEESSSGDTFKNWASKYLLIQSGINFNEVDLWAARCAVLHTSTSESDLSRKGRARELVYYNGDSDNPASVDFVKKTSSFEQGRYVAVNICDLLCGACDAMGKFAHDLHLKCEQNAVSAERLRKLLQLHNWPSSP